VAAAISAADRSLSLVIPISPLDMKKPIAFGFSMEMERRSTDHSNNSSPRYNAA
jgi:hypothetical protein